MNKERRKKLTEIQDKLRELQEELADLQSEEEEYRDNMPENLQGSVRYEEADNACDNLYSATSSIEDAIDSIDEATI